MREDLRTPNVRAAELWARHHGIDDRLPPERITADDVAPMAGADDVGESWFEQAMRERRWER